jgi:phage-related protein
MLYKIIFYNATVQKTILEKWPKNLKASFLKIAEKIEIHGPNLGMPYTKPFRNGLFEIRARGRDSIGRAFFCIKIDREIIILHAFIKKTQETPKSDIDIARKRLSEIIHEK